MDASIVFFAIWGLGIVVLGTIHLVYRWIEYLDYRDARSVRDLVEAVAIWLVCMASAVSIALSIAFSPSVINGMGLRGFLIALAPGAFFGYMLVKVTDRPRRKRKP